MCLLCFSVLHFALFRTLSSSMHTREAKTKPTKWKIHISVQQALHLVGRGDVSPVISCLLWVIWDKNELGVGDPNQSKLERPNPQGRRGQNQSQRVSQITPDFHIVALRNTTIPGAASGHLGTICFFGFSLGYFFFPFNSSLCRNCLAHP